MSKFYKIPLGILSVNDANTTFNRWVNSTQQKLRKNQTKAERAFCRVIDTLKSRMRPWWVQKFHYCPQKTFRIGNEIVFFADFAFENLKLIVEVDGPGHVGHEEEDAWRSRVISDWGYQTIRVTNDQVLQSDFRDVERWFVGEVCSLAPFFSRRLIPAYAKIMRKHRHIYPIKFSRIFFKTVAAKHQSQPLIKPEPDPSEVVSSPSPTSTSAEVRAMDSHLRSISRQS